jgi:phosphohistidine swiveling domain-containing protein
MADTELAAAQVTPARAGIDPHGLHPHGLRGVAAGGRRVVGPARLVRTPEELARVGPGDIAVVEVARAAWMAWLGDAAGLVAETGGTLSNGVIAARERGLTVVVAAAGATTLIRDGQPLLVDGATGLVQRRQPTE